MKPEQLEYRFTPAAAERGIQLQERADDQPAKISGYGAVFYDGTEGSQYRLWDDFVERIMPGAFDRAIREQQDVRSFFNHDANWILARTAAGTLGLSIDAVGLRYEIQPPDTQAGRDVLESIRRRDVTGSSFMFIATDVNWRNEDGVTIREIAGVDLWEVGPVVFPAYDGTTSELRSQLRKLVDEERRRCTPGPRVEIELRRLALRQRACDRRCNVR